MTGQNKQAGTKLLVGTGGLLLAMVGGGVVWDAYGSGGSGSEIKQLQTDGTVTVGSLSEAIYYIPEGAKEDAEKAQRYELELVYSRTEGIPFTEVVADESKLPSKQGFPEPPPFATPNTPTPEEAMTRAGFVKSEQAAFDARTTSVKLSTDKAGFDDAQPMDRHDIVYLKADPEVDPRRYEEVRDYKPGGHGPIGIGVLLAGVAMMGFGLFAGAKRQA